MTCRANFASRRRRHQCCWLLAICSSCAAMLICLACVRGSLGPGDGNGGESRMGTDACAETIERLMKAAGWPGWEVSFLVKLTASEDKQAAAEACLPAAQSKEAATTVEPIDKHCFAEKLSASDRQKSMRHLGTVVRELERVGVQWYLDMGTALGALRHFEMIPYDEDIDIRINAEHKDAARTALSRLRFSWPELLFQDTEWRNQHWKVHFMDTMDPVLQTHVALDIFFYSVNRTSDRLVIPEPPFEFPLGDIFPLMRRPFNGHWYFTPGSVASMISGYFPNTSLADCVYYLHDLPFNQCQQQLLPCERVKARFAFTETLQLTAGQLQYLVDRRLPFGRSVTALAFIAGAVRL